MTLPCVCELTPGIFPERAPATVRVDQQRAPPDPAPSELTQKGAPGHLRSRQRRGGWDCNSHSPHWSALPGERRKPVSKVNIQGHLLRQCPNFRGRRRRGAIHRMSRPLFPEASGAFDIRRWKADPSGAPPPPPTEIWALTESRRRGTLQAFFGARATATPHLLGQAPPKTTLS